MVNVASCSKPERNIDAVEVIAGLTSILRLATPVYSIGKPCCFVLAGSDNDVILSAYPRWAHRSTPDDLSDSTTCVSYIP